MTDILITPIVPSDRPRWDALWAGYLRFYETVLAQTVTETTWSRVSGGNGPVEGIGARLAAGGPLLGFAHFTLHANSWSDRQICYLEDLFVDPAERGAGIGRALIAAVTAEARRRNCARVYWQTQTGNATARRLYDSVATLTDFVRYQITLA